MRDVKIQQITKFEIAKAKVAQKLTAMHREDRFHRLKLDHHQIVDEKINPVPVIDGQSLVSNGNQDLSAGQ